MKQKATGSRILALLLAVTLLASLVIPAAAAGRNDLTQLAVEQIDNDLVTAQLPGQQQTANAAQEETHAASDMVRVSIVLEKKSTLEAGYTAQEVTDSARAMSYRESLQAQQETLSRKISRVALDGQKLDVVWNLTLATNVISANVPYGVEQASKESGVNYASQLLTTGKIETVLDQLNAYQRNAEAENTVTADQLYVNAKAPFGYNYIDGNFDVTHDNDSNGSHGSHVSGIAAANRYLKTEDGYVDALEAVNVAGNAPDAAQVAEYAIPAFQWAVGAGIINGTTASTLSPKGSATCGQVAAILHRYCEWIG